MTKPTIYLAMQSKRYWPISVQSHQVYPKIVVHTYAEMVKLKFRFFVQKILDLIVLIFIFTDEFDYIIVGGGTAGSALANLLSEKSKSSIMLIELGDSARHDSQVQFPSKTSKYIKYIYIVDLYYIVSRSSTICTQYTQQFHLRNQTKFKSMSRHEKRMYSYQWQWIGRY